MKEGRLHLRIDPLLLEKMKEIAKKRNTTLTAVVESHFRQVVAEEEQISVDDIPQA